MKHFKGLMKNKIVRDIRGKGLFIGIQFEEGDLASQFSKILLKNGLIAKPTQKNIIRFSPPLIITKEQANEAIVVICDGCVRVQMRYVSREYFFPVTSR